VPLDTHTTTQTLYIPMLRRFGPLVLVNTILARLPAHLVPKLALKPIC
jgi:hypothetical protein